MEAPPHKKVLIVDDEKEMLLLFSARLQREGYVVDVAFDAMGALTKAVRTRPDCILMDIMMPAGGGMGLLENIRNNSDTFSIPVIVMTASVDPKYKKGAERLGVSGYLLKPFEASQMLEKIKDVIGASTS